MRRSYRITDIICGEHYITSRIYPEYTQPKGSRSKKSKPTTETRAALNDKNRKEYLAHLASTNFTGQDYYITLTYNDEHLPESYNAAVHELRKFISRAKYRAKKGNGRGRVDTSALQFDQFGVAIDNLLSYFYKHIEEARANGVKGSCYYRSRNLKEPEYRSRKGKLSHKQIEWAKTFTDFEVFERMHPDYALADVSTFYNDTNGGYYFTVKYFKPPHRHRRKRNE